MDRNQILIFVKRQNCNIIYENDEFRYKDNEVLKKKVYDGMLKDGVLEYGKINAFSLKISSKF